MAAKRRRGDLSGEQKRQICIYKQENPKSTQEMIVKHFKSKWDVSWEVNDQRSFEIKGEIVDNIKGD